MARLVWRKQNIETVRIAEFARARYAEIMKQVPYDKIDYSDNTLGWANRRFSDPWRASDAWL